MPVELFAESRIAEFEIAFECAYPIMALFHGGSLVRKPFQKLLELFALASHGQQLYTHTTHTSNTKVEGISFECLEWRKGGNMVPLNEANTAIERAKSKAERAKWETPPTTELPPKEEGYPKGDEPQDQIKKRLHGPHPTGNAGY